MLNERDYEGEGFFHGGITAFWDGLRLKWDKLSGVATDGCPNGGKWCTFESDARSFGWRCCVKKFFNMNYVVDAGTKIVDFKGFVLFQHMYSHEVKQNLVVKSQLRQHQ